MKKFLVLCFLLLFAAAGLQSEPRGGDAPACTTKGIQRLG